MNASANQLGTVEVYSPSTNTWKAAANMPGPRIHAAAALGGDGRIYVIGGGTGVGSGGYTTVFAYTP